MCMDFKFVEDPVSKKWIVAAPRRAKRPDIANGEEPKCPFCPGNEISDPEVYRVGGEANDQNWLIRVVKNKFPFAPIHEVIVHSPIIIRTSKSYRFRSRSWCLKPTASVPDAPR